MKKIIPNISVENCSEAIEFYKEVFGGETKNVQISDGKELFVGIEGKVIHSELHINSNCILFFSDVLRPQTKGDNISILLELERKGEIEDIYNSLKEEGNVFYELQKTFWGSYHAVVTDKYSITWNLDCPAV